MGEGSLAGLNMRVLFLVTYFPKPQVPLAGTWAIEQARALRNAVDLHVLCFTPHVPRVFAAVPKARPWIDVPHFYDWGDLRVEYLKALYYPVWRLKAWSFPNPLAQMQLAWQSVRRGVMERIERFEPDILFCHHTAASGYIAHRVHLLTGLPYVITDHDFDEVSQCERYPRRHAFFRQVLKEAGRHLSVAKRMELDVRRLFPGVPTETLHNGINLTGVVQPGKRSHAAAPEQLVIFATAMFAPRKGLPLLVEAFSEVAEQFPSAVLRIAGDGEDRPAIEAAVARAGLGQRVTLLGLLPHEQVLREMADCDLFALVSWDEPFGVVYLEAMSLGKPVIACADAGIADRIRDGQHGRLVPPKDTTATARALTELLGSAELRQRMGKCGMQLVQDELTWARNAERLVEIFESLKAH